jgi:hypothetical protein
LDKALETLKEQISQLPDKQQKIFEKWLHTWSTYIGNEREFDPTRLRTYKRGEIVHLHLGYNVGSEEGKNKDSLHSSEVYLGEIIPGFDREAYALPLHIRGISKMRIIKPRRDEHGVYKVSPKKLTEIDDKIKLLFTHKKLLT